MHKLFGKKKPQGQMYQPNTGANAYQRYLPFPGTGLLFKESRNKLPIVASTVDLSILESLSVTKMTQEFTNPESGDACEISYVFPKSNNSVVSKFVFKVGDKVIESKIYEQEEAKDKYDDAVATGKSAAIMGSQRDYYDIEVGNVAAGQNIVVEITILAPLQISRGSFDYTLPVINFPTEGRDNLQFNANIQSSQKLSHISYPKNCEILSQNENQIVLTKKYQVFDQNIHMYYRTEGMDSTKCYFQENEEKYPGQVALMTQFLPTFEEAPLPQASPILNDNEQAFEELEMDTCLEDDQKYCIIFVVDRSGSMSGTPMNITKRALQLFMQSLPCSCKYQIISFGTDFDYLYQQPDMPQQYPQAQPAYQNYDQDEEDDDLAAMMALEGGEAENTLWLDYNDDLLRQTKDSIEGFKANYGGTDIYQPLKSAFAQKVPQGYKKRIFLLTDGSDGMARQNIDLIDQNCRDGNTKVFSFGLGNGSDQHFIKGSANAGKGKSYFISQPNEDELKEKVIDALEQATEEAFFLKNCSVNFGVKEKDKSLLVDATKTVQLNNLSRYQMVQTYSIMTKEQFEKEMVCTFKCDYSPQEKKAFQKQFGRDQFIPFEIDQDCLFKLAAKYQIDQLSNKNDKIKLSTAYQVLCDETSFVAVAKQTKKIEEPVQQATKFASQSFDPATQVGNFDQQIDNLEMRIKKVEADSIRYKKEALSRKKGGDQRGAVQALKKSKMMEKELAKYEGQQLMMEQQRMMIESTSYDQNVFSGMKAGQIAQSQMQTNYNTDGLDDLTDDLQEMMAEQDEVAEMFAQYEQNDDLLDELDEMEADAQMDDMCDMMPMGSLQMAPAQAMASPSAPQHVVQQQKSAPKVVVPTAVSTSATAQTDNLQPSYDSIISSQSSNGSWSASCLSFLLKFLTADHESQLQSIIKDVDASVVITISFLIILRLRFADKQKQWKLIQKKSQKWLRAQNVQDLPALEAKVQNIISQN